MSHPTLSSLTDREAIADALYRAAIACDKHDAPLFDSAFVGEDVTMEVHDSPTPKILQGLSFIRTMVLNRVGPMDTTHNIGMVRVNHVSGTDTASLTATSTNVHAAPGTGRDPNGKKYVVGGEYTADLVKDGKDGEGLWRIKKIVLNVIWTEGDASLMAPPQKPQ